MTIPPKLTITQDDDGLRLDQLLKQRFKELPYGLLQKAFRTGKVRLNDKRMKSPGTRVKTGDTVTLYLSVREPDNTPPGSPNTKIISLAKDFEAWILFEDKDLLVLNKPPGLATQAGTNTTISLDRILIQYAEERYLPRITHRLDKDTSGIIVFAKSRQAAQHMTKLFKEGTPIKTYWACVVGKPEKNQGKIDLPLGKLIGIQKEKMSSKASDVRPALTYYKIIESNATNNISWLELTPKTGRTHQLRVHCAESDFPILGDGKYGGRQAHPFQSRVPLCLHARSLTFQHPAGHEKTITAPLPPAFEETMRTYIDSKGY